MHARIQNLVTLRLSLDYKDNRTTEATPSTSINKERTKDIIQQTAFNISQQKAPAHFPTKYKPAYQTKLAYKTVFVLGRKDHGESYQFKSLLIKTNPIKAHSSIS